LYKCYELFKTMQEKNKEIKMLHKEVIKEINCDEDWECNIDIHYDDKPVTVEDVKELCDEYFNKE
jgi:hypothetical protein